jgi:molybdate transport system substrate-binding protein
MREPRLAPFALLLLLAGCGRGGGPVAAEAVAAVTAPAGPHELAVFATASLREAFTALARRYEQDHPGALVVLRCEGGAALLAAMNGGARADVIAIGDSSLMSRFASAALLAPGSPTELARNRITIAVRAGNPLGIRGLADLSRADVRVALGARSASIGRHARWALSRRQLEVVPRIEGNCADDLLAAVTRGDADAGIVYTTTMRGAAGVDAVAVPEADNTPALYSISLANGAAEPLAAAAFRALALSAAGQAILHDAGFLPIGAK